MAVNPPVCGPSSGLREACIDVAASDPDVPLGPDFVKYRLEKGLADLTHFVGELQTP